MSDSDSQMVQAAKEEVLDFHVFLQEWFSGAREMDEDFLDRRLTAFHSDFRYFGPSGNIITNADLRGAYPGRHGFKPSISIEIRDLALRLETPDTAIVTYREVQTDPTDADFDHVRLSTAVFLPEARAPRGVVWFHLHEVFEPADGRLGRT